MSLQVTATREFNQYGYVWYPEVWVEALLQWVPIGSVKYAHPEGFPTPRQAIEAGLKATE